MNKLTKSAIAGAAGIALLLGGAGSLAYWNSSATVGAATINSGQLKIVATPATTTTFYTGTSNAVTLVVPGDSVTVTQGVTITATGDHLKASLKIDEPLLLGTLKQWITTPIEVHAYKADGTTEVTGLNNLSVANAALIKFVKVVIIFPSSVGDTVGTVNHGQDGTGSDLQLGTLNILLTQIP